jgi:hypothetical protein
MTSWLVCSVLRPSCQRVLIVELSRVLIHPNVVGTGHSPASVLSSTITHVILIDT